MERLVPYSQSGILAKIRSSGELVDEDYRPDGIYIRAYVPRALYHMAAFGEEG
jgi:GTP-binding protein HflX